MKIRKDTLTALIMTGAALLFILLVKVVDVEAIGPDGSSVGFAALNGAVWETLGVKLVWYDISQALGYLAILVCLFFAVLGAYQLIKEKSIRKVDRHFLLLGALYALTLLLYVLFDKIVINYRPVLENGVLEPSYPSSHTMLGLVGFGSAAWMIGRYFAEKRPRLILTAVLLLLMALTVITRLLSGFHWLTDIIGGVLTAGALMAWFIWACCRIDAQLQ